MMDAAYQTPAPEKKNKGHKGSKYLLYIAIVLVATGISLFFALYGKTEEIGQAIGNCFTTKDGWFYVLVIVGVVVLSYLIDALIILVFCRLYTRRYKYHQGVATSLIGQFYSDVTPGASGGQIMQVYTMKSQGISVSSAASIAVMWYILYQIALIIFDLVAFGVEFKSIMSIKTIDLHIGDWNPSFPMTPLIIVGFLLNVSVIFLLMAMSYSHKFHNFILHYVIGFLGKIRLVKNADKTRENLRVQVENFKIELRRLQANIPVVILQLILFLLLLFCRNCIPYLAGMAMHCEAEFSFVHLMDSSFLSAFHQMVTGLMPLPGAAGVSEYFYTILYGNFFSAMSSPTGLPSDVIVSSSLLLWRTATFHAVLAVSGLVAAFYRSRPKETIHYANRQTFVTIQMETYDERLRSAQTMYETATLSRKEIQRKIAESLTVKRKKGDRVQNEENDGLQLSAPPKKEPKPKKPKKEKKPSKKKSKEDWETLNL